MSVSGMSKHATRPAAAALSCSPPRRAARDFGREFGHGPAVARQVARAGGGGDMREVEQLAPAQPARQAEEGIAAQDQHQRLRAAELRAQRVSVCTV